MNNSLLLFYFHQPGSYNGRQNELRHFTLKGLFDVFLTSKAENKTFPPPFPQCNVMSLFELPSENNKHPNFEWRTEGRGVDSFVLWSYPIWVHVSIILTLIVGMNFGNSKLACRTQDIPISRPAVLYRLCHWGCQTGKNVTLFFFLVL